MQDNKISYEDILSLSKSLCYIYRKLFPFSLYIPEKSKEKL